MSKELNILFPTRMMWWHYTCNKLELLDARSTWGVWRLWPSASSPPWQMSGVAGLGQQAAFLATRVLPGLHVLWVLILDEAASKPRITPHSFPSAASFSNDCTRCPGVEPVPDKSVMLLLSLLLEGWSRLVNIYSSLWVRCYSSLARVSDFSSSGSDSLPVSTSLCLQLARALGWSWPPAPHWLDGCVFIHSLRPPSS